MNRTQAIKIEDAQTVIDGLYLNFVDNRIECSYCSNGNFVFVTDIEGGKDQLAKRMHDHFDRYHRERSPFVEAKPPTEQEIQTAVQSLTSSKKS